MRLPRTGGEGKYSAISRHLPLEDGMREARGGCTVTPAFSSRLPWLLSVPFQNKVEALAPQFMALPTNPRAEG